MIRSAAPSLAAGREAREAAFWCAFSLRNTARNRGDLDQARQELDSAMKYCEEDKADSGSEEFDPREVRFEAERLALDVSKACFDVFRVWWTKRFEFPEGHLRPS